MSGAEPVIDGRQGRLSRPARSALCLGLLCLLGALPGLARFASAESVPRVAAIRFEGNRSFGDHVLLRWMSLQRPHPFVRTRFSMGEFLSDLERLRRFYRGEGFLAVRIDGTAEEKKGARILIRVEEGPRWRLTDCALMLRGPEATAALGDSLLRRLEVRLPGPYRLGALVVDRDRLERLLADRGLMDARVQLEDSRDDSCHLARIRWRVETGPRARYAGSRVYGLSRVEVSAVEREVAVRPGRELRAADIAETRDNLLRTGLFPAVDVLPAPSDSGRADKHLVILVHEEPAGAITAGAGYGTSDHARILATFEHRNLDGGGVRLSLRGVYGERRRGGDGQVVFPWVFGHRVSLILGGGHERIWRRPYTAEFTRGSLHLSRQLGTNTRGVLGYRLERQELIRVRPGFAVPAHTQLGTITFGLGRDTRDDLWQPSRGSYLHLGQDLSLPWLGGRHHFARMELEQVQHQGLGPLTFSLRTRLGWIAPQTAGTSAPLNERFFAGGLHTIRGFPEDAVGPQDANGDPIGGRVLATGSLEARTHLVWKLGASVFADAGELVVHMNALTWRSMSVGAGAGLLFDSPVGRVQAYAAVPLTKRFRDRTQLYVVTGAAF